ncbi:MAG: ketoacyl-ACP synthase III [Deltaproteobacteria bacterium]|nr:ketoacyl-ACP synthase III [Deltaproteobacteria bacterium]MBW2123293.1 ketoacyl-ACP synthase III [Deltaproteobacteria bacterium]
MRRIAIMGTGSYVPDRVLTNTDLEKILWTSDEWISKRTGVRERRIAAHDQYASDLGREASLRAMEVAGLSPLEVELIVLCTMTPDTACPSGANWLEASLGAENAVSFDVVAACSGFVFGLSVAEQYLKTGVFGNALVVASEVMSRTLDWTDRESCILWGDGSGAVVLKAVEGDDGGYSEILSTHIHTDGKNGQNLLLPGGGSKTTPISHRSVDQRLHTLRMIRASDSVRVAVRYFAEAAEEAVFKNGYTLDDVKVIVPHQANIRILQQMAKRLKVPMEKVYLTVAKYGNISSATVPIALDEAVRDGTIEKGDLVVLTAFGGGLTWGSSLIRW